MAVFNACRCTIYAAISYPNAVIIHLCKTRYAHKHHPVQCIHFLLQPLDFFLLIFRPLPFQNFATAMIRQLRLFSSFLLRFYFLPFSLRTRRSSLHTGPHFSSTSSIGIATMQTRAIKVKHHPHPMTSIMMLMIPVPPAPMKQRMRLFAAVVDGDWGYKSTTRVLKILNAASKSVVSSSTQEQKVLPTNKEL